MCTWRLLLLLVVLLFRVCDIILIYTHSLNHIQCVPKNIRKFVEGDESRREKKHTAQQNTTKQSQRAKIIHRVVHFVCAVDSLEWNGICVFFGVWCSPPLYYCNPFSWLGPVVNSWNNADFCPKWVDFINKQHFGWGATLLWKLSMKLGLYVQIQAGTV